MSIACKYFCFRNFDQFFSCFLFSNEQSTSGTFVNEKRIKEEQKLKINDLIGIGVNPLRSYGEQHFVFSLQAQKPEEISSIEMDEDDLFGSSELDIAYDINKIIARLEEDETLDAKNTLTIIPRLDLNMDSNENCPIEVSKPLEFWDEIEIIKCPPQLQRCTVEVQNMQHVSQLFDTIPLSSLTSSKKFLGKRKLDEASDLSPKEKMKIKEILKDSIRKTSRSKSVSKKSSPVVKVTNGIHFDADDPCKKINKSSKSFITTSNHQMKSSKSEISPVIKSTKGRKPRDSLISQRGKKKAKNEILNDSVLETFDMFDVKQSMPSTELKSILIKSKDITRSPKKVSFCKVVYIKRFVKDDDGDDD